MMIIGIDVGLTGAIAAVGHNRCAVRDLPTVPDGKGRRLDGRELILELRALIAPGETAIVVIEDVRPRPNALRGTTMHSEGSLMRSRGIIEAVTDIARLELRVVQPQTWKRHFGLIKSKKGASLEVARRLFPNLPEALKRVKDHNRAESLLIAHWAQGHYG